MLLFHEVDTVTTIVEAFPWWFADHYLWGFQWSLLRAELVVGVGIPVFGFPRSERIRGLNIFNDFLVLILTRRMWKIIILLQIVSEGSSSESVTRVVLQTFFQDPVELTCRIKGVNLVTGIPPSTWDFGVSSCGITICTSVPSTRTAFSVRLAITIDPSEASREQMFAISLFLVVVASERHRFLTPVLMIKLIKDWTVCNVLALRQSLVTLVSVGSALVGKYCRLIFFSAWAVDTATDWFWSAVQYT